jgi:predicted secreted acid phosphatase
MAIDNHKVIREKTGKKTITIENGISRKIEEVGEIHMVLKDKHGKIKEERLTIDKQKERKNGK